MLVNDLTLKHPELPCLSAVYACSANLGYPLVANNWEEITRAQLTLT